MSTDNLNSTNYRTGSEQFYRGNRHRRQQGGRPYHHRRYSNTRTSASQNSRVAVANRSPSNLNDRPPSNLNDHPPSNLNDRSLSNLNGDQSSISPNDSICFICAEPVHYLAVSECNHKLCHLCSLRLRALYKNKNCAYCKTEQIKIIFTRYPDKGFQELKDSDNLYSVGRLNAFCEDEEMYEDIKLLLGYNCPDSKCEVLCNGWGDLKRHVKIEHRLLLCDICTRHKKIFTHEHSLFTREELNKHIREGDEVTGFNGHPECQFCEKPFYGDDELYEHCRDNHEQCFICVRAGARDSYFRNYNSLEEHFGLEHYLCQHQECLDKKFIVFGSDIDLKAHEVNVHGANFGGQRANRYEASRIETNFNYGNSHTRGRGRWRSRERQPERWTDSDGPAIDEITRQTQNLNLDSTTSAINGTAVNARAVRPPPGFGVLSPDEVIGPADELLENEVEIRNFAFTQREEDFPTLSDAMKVPTSNNNNSGTIINYSEKLKQKPKSKPRLKPADKPTQSVASSSRSVAAPKPPQQPLFESTNTINKRKDPAFPPLPSANQSISASSGSSSSVLNYREKALSGIVDSDISSHNFTFYQRVNTFLSNDSAKMEEFRSLTIAYNSSILDEFSYIESLLSLFNKNTDTVGKVVSGLVGTLEDDKKKAGLLRAWHDHKAKKTADFPALEPIYSTTPSGIQPYITTSSNKPSARVLVIKSSTNRSGGTKTSSGSRVWDKIAAIAESKTKDKSNSAFPSLATSATATSSNNNAWNESFAESPSRSESTSSSLNSPNISPYTTTFVRGRPTKAENDEFPVLPSTSTSSTPRFKNNGPEKNAWGQGGAFASIVSDNNQNENDSEDDSLYSESTKERGKKKKQKKQKTVLFHHGQKNTSNY